MGERIRSHDWSATPLGPISGWPPSLRSVVSLCVKSRFPIIIHWGWPDLTVIYNDAFIPLIGDEHRITFNERDKVGTPAVLGFAGWNRRSLTDNAPDVMFSMAANTPVSLGIGKESVTSKPSKTFPYVPAAVESRPAAAGAY